MRFIGVELQPPRRVDFILAGFWAVLGGLLGALVIVPLVGGNPGLVPGLAAAGASAGLLASVGASYDKAGLRGMVLTVLTGLVVFWVVRLLA
jgi:hypothetical protein